MRRLFALALLAASIAHAAPLRTEHVEAQLVAERTAVEPGKSVTVALRLKTIPGWHTYWRNPGDSGQPTSIRWTLPAGYAAGPIQWPAPEKLPIGPLANYGYEGEVFLLTDIAAPAGAKANAAIAAHARWLVCNPERCIPEEGDFSLGLGKGPGRDGPYAAQIRFTRELLPQPAGAGWKLSATRRGGAVELAIAGPAGFSPTGLQFFPYDEGKVQPAPAQRLSSGNGLTTLALPVAAQPVGTFDRVSGILVAPGQPPVEVDVPVAAGAAPAGAQLGLAAALGFALVGGLILNLMPCVLPVLSIKVLGFARGHSHAAMRAHGLLYGAGVVGSFVALAGLLIAFQSAGHAVGWGFQLQSPAFVAIVALLFFALALNLSGVYEFGALVPASIAAAHVGGPRADAFFTGVLAVVVASPCTSPFMGAALGYALGESALHAFAVFAALGVGMAAPYVLLAFRPQWLKHIPKPGAWMAHLKQFLAFPLYATVIWLAWVLGVQSGLEAVVWLLGALLVLGAAGWLAGMATPRRWVQRAGAIALAAAAIALAIPGPQAAANKAAAAEGWAPWSEARVAALQREGRPVFVDFTAAWCVTCQLNKQLVLGRAEIQDAFRAHGVTLLRADWTRQDPAITRALAALGRNGVPVYAYYRPGQGPELLPEILTRDAVLAALAASTR